MKRGTTVERNAISRMVRWDMFGRAIGIGLAGFVAGCGAHQERAPATTPTDPQSPPHPIPSAQAPTPSSNTPASARRCGELGCLAFRTPREAFEHALSSNPRIIALG